MPIMNRQKATALVAAAAATFSAAGIASAVNTATTPSGGDAAQTQDQGQGQRGPSGGKGRGGHRPHRPLTDDQLSQIGAKLGITSDALKAAMEKSRPQPPAQGNRGQGPRGGRGPDGLAQALATELGVEKAAVLTILEANRPERPKPELSKVVTALATGLDKDEATVKAAFDKIIAAHEAAKGQGPRGGRGPGKMFDALATELKLDAATVKSAFESVLGTPPAKQKAAKRKAAAAAKTTK